MSSESSRFQHLLQPIRDLSKNWNIDLAQELEEYLDELEHLSIAFDPTTATTTAAAAAAKNSSSQNSNAQLMNFAEAALLIQGTSMIYSRKVEYLYALVFQTLAHLSKQQHGVTGEDGELLEDGEADGSGGEDDGDQEDGGVGGAAGGRKRRRARGNGTLDVWANPLPIYDEVEEAKNITLKTQNQNQVQNQSHKRSADMVKSKNNIQASIALMGSLVPDERDHGETFKLLSCHLHPSGVLLMDDASKKYLQDESTYYTSMATATASQRLQQTPMAKLNFSGNLDTSMASDGGQDPFNGVGGGGEYDYDDDDNNEPMDDAGYDYGGGGDGDDGDNANVAGSAGGEGHEDPDSKHDIFSTPMVKPEPGQSRDSAALATMTTMTTTSAAAADAKDPWAALDPYDASKSTVRPFRKGRSYPARSAKKILANKKNLEQQEEDEIDGVDDPGFKERFLLSANRPQWSTWVWNDLDERALEQKFKKKYCKSPCLLTSCESLWKLETKWKSLVRKSNAASAQSAQAILIQEQGEEEEQQQLQAMAFVPEPVAADTDGGHAGQDDDDDDDDDGGGDDNGMDYGGDDDWDTHNASALSLLDASSAVFKNGGTASGAPLHQDGDRALSYEEICRQHLEEFMKGTEKYIRETDLTRQVNDWQDKLSPILKEQDAHPPFDIQRYGREIIGHLEATVPTQKKNKKNKKQQKDDDDDRDDRDAVPFSDVVGGLQSFEVCRMFLASLQLANNGNVELLHAKTASDQRHVPFEMQLLTTANAYESLQT